MLAPGSGRAPHAGVVAFQRTEKLEVEGAVGGACRESGWGVWESSGW